MSCDLQPQCHDRNRDRSSRITILHGLILRGHGPSQSFAISLTRSLSRTFATLVNFRDLGCSRSFAISSFALSSFALGSLGSDCTLVMRPSVLWPLGLPRRLTALLGPAAAVALLLSSRPALVASRSGRLSLSSRPAPSAFCPVASRPSVLWPRGLLSLCPRGFLSWCPHGFLSWFPSLFLPWGLGSAARCRLPHFAFLVHSAFVPVAERRVGSLCLPTSL